VRQDNSPQAQALTTAQRVRLGSSWQWEVQHTVVPATNDPGILGRESSTLIIGARSEKECICKSGFYKCPSGANCDTTKVGDGIPPGCLVCPTGGNCTAQGTDLYQLGTRTGYWRATNATLNFHVCDPLLSDTCNGSPKGGFDRDQQCNTGYTGLRCEVCDYGNNYVKKIGGSCGKCAKGEGKLALIGTLCMLMLLIIFGCLMTGRCGKCFVDRVLTALQERSMKLRILLAFTQVCTRLRVSFRLVLPAAVVNLFQVLSWFEFFDLFALTASIKCMHVNDLIDTIWVKCVGGMALLMGTFVLARLDPNTKRRRAWMDFVLGFSFLIYPSMTATLFSFFDCKTFEDDRSYLLPDPTIDCNSSRYSNTRGLVMLMILVFVVGIPCFYLVMLYPVRKIINPTPPYSLRKDVKAAIRWQIDQLDKLRDRHQLPAEARSKEELKLWNQEEQALQLSFLYRAYIPSMWYFEIAEMMRKFMLTGLPMLTRLLTSESAHIELVYGLLIVFISSLVYSGTPPYRRKADQFLMLPTQFVLTLTLSGGALLSYRNDTGTEIVVSAVIIFVCAVVVLVIMYAVMNPDSANAFAEDMKPGLFSSLWEPVLKPHLSKLGLKWADIVPVLKEVDSLDELQAAIEDPEAFLSEIAVKLQSRLRLAKEDVNTDDGRFTAVTNPMQHASPTGGDQVLAGRGLRKSTPGVGNGAAANGTDAHPWKAKRASMTAARGSDTATAVISAPRARHQSTEHQAAV
jgi:hypothetical protein